MTAASRKRFKAQRLYVAAEGWPADDTLYATDPDSDGSDYKFVPVNGAVSVSFQHEVIEQDFQTNRLMRHPHIIGGNGVELTFSVPLYGLGTASGDGDSPVADDFLDVLIEAALGSVDEDGGEGVASTGHSTSTARLDQASPMAADSLVLLSGQVRYVDSLSTGSVSNDTINVQPNWTVGDTPADADIAYGAKNYSPLDTTSMQNSLAFIFFHDDVEYLALGCVCARMALTADSRSRPMLEFRFIGDSIATSSHASVPNATRPAYSAPIVKGSPVYFGSTLDTLAASVREKVSAFNIAVENDVQPLLASEGTEGRWGFHVAGRTISGTITPFYNSSRFTEFTGATELGMLVQIGAGTLASSRVNTIGIFAPKIQWTGFQHDDVGGAVGHALPFQVNDAGLNASNAALKHLIFARF